MAIGSGEVALKKEEVIQEWAENRFGTVINNTNKNRKQNESIKCRINFQSPAKSETSKADRALLTKLRKEQARDQEAAQDKKEVDASPSKLHDRRFPSRSSKENRVAKNDEKDGHSAQAVQLNISSHGNRLLLPIERFRRRFVELLRQILAVFLKGATQFAGTDVGEVKGPRVQ